MRLSCGDKNSDQSIENRKVLNYDTQAMKKYKAHTLQEYLTALSQKTPVPGGGSAAALVGSLGAGLISMTANYSTNRNQPRSVEVKIKTILKKSEIIRKRLLDLVDLDARAYLNVVKSRNIPSDQKKKALRQARAVPQEVCRLCLQAIDLTPFLVLKGNKYLLSDVKVAVEFLSAAFSAAKINVEVNR